MKIEAESGSQNGFWKLGSRSGVDFELEIPDLKLGSGFEAHFKIEMMI